MIGVRRSHGGTGVGRQLLKAVHRLAQDDASSTAVTLATENPRNVALYEHFGYRVIGQASVADGIETWAMYKAMDRG